MLESYLNSPVTRRRLRASLAADHIDASADWLHIQGYRPTSINSLLRALAGWTDWMFAAGFTMQDPLAGFHVCKLTLEQKQRVRYSRGPSHYSITAASVFIRFLQHQREISHRSRAWLRAGSLRFRTKRSGC
jgi:integrase/recombinase XerD